MRDSGEQALDWLSDHPESTVPYKGQWIAVVSGSGIIAAAFSLVKLAEQVALAPESGAAPLVTFVPEYRDNPSAHLHGSDDAQADR